MDKRELRNFMGSTHHFNPKMNPKPPGTPPAKRAAAPVNRHLQLNKKDLKISAPMSIPIQRQVSSDSPCSSPVGSPVTTGQAFSFPGRFSGFAQMEKAQQQLQQLQHKPKIYGEFDFGK